METVFYIKKLSIDISYHYYQYFYKKRFFPGKPFDNLIFFQKFIKKKNKKSVTLKKKI